MPGANAIPGSALAALGSSERGIATAFNTPGGNPLDAFAARQNTLVNLLNPSRTTPPPTTPHTPSAPNPGSAPAPAAPTAAAPTPATTPLSQLSGFANQNMTPAEQSLMAAQLTSGRGGATGVPFATTIPSGGRFYQVPLSQFPSYNSPEEANRRYKALSDWLNNAAGSR